MIKLEIDLYADIQRDSIPYRIYVNDELMTERDYVWDNKEQYITEVVPLFLGEGVHTINVENLYPKNGSLKINTIRVDGKTTTLFNGREFKL